MKLCYSDIITIIQKTDIITIISKKHYSDFVTIILNIFVQILSQSSKISYYNNISQHIQILSQSSQTFFFSEIITIISKLRYSDIITIISQLFFDILSQSSQKIRYYHKHIKKHFRYYHNHLKTVLFRY